MPCGESCLGLTVESGHFGSLRESPSEASALPRLGPQSGLDGVFPSRHTAILQQSQENNFWAIVHCQACIPILQLKTSLLAPATHEIE